MKKSFLIPFFILLISLFSICGCDFFKHDKTAQQESILERVKRTKTLTCAYWLWPNLVEKDPNSGVMSGVIVDIIEKVGKNLQVKVDWKEEATVDNFIQLISSGRVDAICGPMAPIPFLRPLAHFSPPVLYTAFDIYVRAKDMKFDAGKETLDRPDAQILTLDGSAGKYFSSTYFPNAKQNSLPAVLGAGQVLLDLKNGKAEATISDQMTAERFLDNNPGSISRQRWNDKPLLMLGITPFIIKRDETVWANTLDEILFDLVDFGDIDQILTAHHMIAGKHYQALAPRYQK